MFYNLTFIHKKINPLEERIFLIIEGITKDFCKVKYENRHKGRVTSIVYDINNTYNNDKMIMKKLEMTQGYVEYRYVLSLKLSDIDDFILPYIYNKNKIDDYISHEVTNIFNIIIKYSTSIFRAL